MSDIPKARAILRKVMDEGTVSSVPYQNAIKRALVLMTRDSPKFRARNQHSAPTAKQIKAVKVLRGMGLSLQAISTQTGLQIGHVSEIVNGKI
jgi:hypothetical protein